MVDKNNKTRLVNKEAEKYYDDTLWLYNLFYSNDALHYGFWNKDTKKLSDAIRNTNIFVAELLDLNKDDYVLDAGCGVGGTSLFMAEKFKVKVTGITLSARQLTQAKRKAAKKKLSKIVNFEKMDFNKTAFQKETFTKIFGIESICHAYDKLDFLKEAYRILKVGGKIVVADGFLSKKQLTEKEKLIYKKCLLGWKVNNLSHRDDFLNYLKTAGFKNIKFYDKKKYALPTCDRIAYRGYLLFPFSYILSKLKIIPKNIHENSITCINQRKTFNSFTTYGVFEAEK